MSNFAVECVEMLRDYLRIDTTNPPGNMNGAVEFYGKICEKEGIPYEVRGCRRERPNFIAKLAGSGKKPPIILLNHMDVVPADEKRWSVPPFDGVVRDGFLYGRGALDMKSMGIFELAALISLKRSGMVPCRDFYFVGVPDEEIGSPEGVSWLVENMPEIKSAEAVINESIPICLNDDGVVEAVEIAVSEKVNLTLVLRAHGRPGHASIPSPQNPNLNIIRALHKILSNKPEPMVNPVVRRYFDLISKSVEPSLGEKYRNLEESLKDDDFRAQFYRNNFFRALVNNTQTPTILRAGVKGNVIPGESEAAVDCRLLPGFGIDEFVEEMRALINDDKVELIISERGSEAPSSDANSDVYKVIADVFGEFFPEAMILPSMPVFTTDSRYFRAKGINSYGIHPAIIARSDFSGIHGNDERISLDSIAKGVEIMTTLVEKLGNLPDSLSVKDSLVEALKNSL